MPPDIPFHRPDIGAPEQVLVAQALAGGRLAGGGDYTRACEQHLAGTTGAGHVLLTSSGTHALELAALLLDVQPGDEVICPSFTFSSTANAFVLRGARPVFVDVTPGDMNIDPVAVAAAIGPRTVGIVPVHYAGACGDMDALLDVARRHDLWIVEDAAQAAYSRFRGRALGTLGTLGAFSFHATKNFTAGGEGGALLAGDDALAARARVARDKGTDRARFLAGEVARYQWQAPGSSWLVSELQAACLLAQLQRADALLAARHRAWSRYHAALADAETRGRLARPQLHPDCVHNAHAYWIRLPDAATRAALQAHCARQGIATATHFVPLHASPAGQRLGEFRGEDRWTSSAAASLLRLPLWAGIDDDAVDRVVAAVGDFAG